MILQSHVSCHLSWPSWLQELATRWRGADLSGTWHIGLGNIANLCFRMYRPASQQVDYVKYFNKMPGFNKLGVEAYWRDAAVVAKTVQGQTTPRHLFAYDRGPVSRGRVETEIIHQVAHCGAWPDG